MQGHIYSKDEYMVNLVAYGIYFHSFEALNYAFEVHFFQGFIFTPYQRHWAMQLRFLK